MADLLGGWAARRLGIAVEAYPADWEREGRAAGPLRNARMLRAGRPGLVLAFHDRLPESRGTRDMLVRAVAAGVRTRVVSHAQAEGTSSMALGKLEIVAGAAPPARRFSPISQLSAGGTRGRGPDPSPSAPSSAKLPTMASG